LLPGGS